MGAFRAYLSGWIREKKIRYRVRYKYLKMFPGCRIESILSSGTEQLISTNVVIEQDVKIANDIAGIGRGIYIGRGAVIASCERIGNFTSISAGVKIGLMAHPDEFISTSPLFYAPRRGWVRESLFDESLGKRTIIGHDVLISANAMIRNGVTIGHGAIVGAGTFVNEDVPPYAIVAGLPAKVIRYRFDEAMIARLLRSEWWNCSDDQIRSAGNFNDPQKFLDALGK